LLIWHQVGHPQLVPALKKPEEIKKWEKSASKPHSGLAAAAKHVPVNSQEVPKAMQS
jgi:hypothetical protein